MQPSQALRVVAVQGRRQAIRLIDDAKRDVDLIWQIVEARGNRGTAVVAIPSRNTRTVRSGGPKPLDGLRVKSREGGRGRACPAFAINAMAIGDGLRWRGNRERTRAAIAARRKILCLRRQPDAPRPLQGCNGAAGFRCPFSASMSTMGSPRMRLAYADRRHRARTRGT